MKTKLKTLTRSKLEKLLENNNFRNNQNYLLGKKISSIGIKYAKNQKTEFFKSYLKVSLEDIIISNKLNIFFKILYFIFNILLFMVIISGVFARNSLGNSGIENTIGILMVIGYNIYYIYNKYLINNYYSIKILYDNKYLLILRNNK